MRRQTDFFETESLTTFGQRGDKFYPYFFFSPGTKMYSFNISGLAR